MFVVCILRIRHTKEESGEIYSDPSCCNIMGKIVGIIGCFLVMGLDTIAGVLGIRAEAAQNQVNTCFLVNQLARKKYVMCTQNFTALNQSGEAFKAMDIRV